MSLKSDSSARSKVSASSPEATPSDTTSTLVGSTSNAIQCSNFEPQQWRRSVCKSCFKTAEQHFLSSDVASGAETGAGLRAAGGYQGGEDDDIDVYDYCEVELSTDTTAGIDSGSIDEVTMSRTGPLRLFKVGSSPANGRNGPPDNSSTSTNGTFYKNSNTSTNGRLRFIKKIATLRPTVRFVLYAYPKMFAIQLFEN